MLGDTDTLTFHTYTLSALRILERLARTAAGKWPGGYQDASIDRDGTVVYHSDPTGNLRENFFAETEQDPQLRSRTFDGKEPGAGELSET